MSKNEPHPEDLVRVRDTATGIDTNVAYAYAIAAGLEILDEPAQVAFGKARPATRALSGRRHEKPYLDLTIPALKAEIEKRNAERPDETKVAAAGNKADLVAALEADDAALTPNPAPTPTDPSGDTDTLEGDDQ